MDKPYGLHWFRRDLRVAGNPALGETFRRHEGRVLGIFCFDKAFLARPDFSRIRFRFFLNTLHALKRELLELGGDLLVLDEGPDPAFAALFAHLKKHPWGLPAGVSWNRDYEPFARARDERLEAFFRGHGVAVHTEADHLLLEPGEVHKGEDPGEGYQVYTPFSRRWLEVFRGPAAQARVARQKKGLAFLRKRAAGDAEPMFHRCWSQFWGSRGPLVDVLDDYRAREGADDPALPAAGSLAALAALDDFAGRIDGYAGTRDRPDLPGTSRLSIYLKNGSLTVAQIVAALDLKPYAPKETGGRAKFFSELIWREFYYHVLYRHPWVEHGAFQARFQALAWENDAAKFERWKAGTTGFPIVDAGMRQLNATGWMHNRVRMIVASFLTKDLLIDWRWGERYFMEKLLDGDLAPNNGGWQWAASTGCDPQPYFRIFNPWSQGAKFDPEGAYVRAHVPELAGTDARALHDPAGARPPAYPRPMVDHAVQRARALALFGKTGDS